MPSLDLGQPERHARNLGDDRGRPDRLRDGRRRIRRGTLPGVNPSPRPLLGGLGVHREPSEERTDSGVPTLRPSCSICSAVRRRISNPPGLLLNRFQPLAYRLCAGDLGQLAVLAHAPDWQWRNRATIRAFWKWVEGFNQDNEG